MKPSSRPLLGTVLVLAFPLPAAAADTITKTDGTVIEDVTIQSETLTQVTYQQGSSTSTVPSDQVLSVEFATGPEDLDEAKVSLAEGDVASAAQFLTGYVQSQSDRPTDRRFPWAPAHATYRAMELWLRLFDLPSAREAAVLVVERFPESRYVPLAHLTRAEIEALAGDAEAARASLDALESLVSSKGLSKRWELEAKLARARLDGGKAPASKRAELGQIAKEAAGSFPTVASRALVAEGESYLLEAEGEGDSAKAKDLRAKARGVFDRVIEDPTADHGALAGAYTGLGDCLFFAGAAADDEELLRQAAKRYLRVVVNHPGEVRYVPKALFYAMRCFQLLGDAGRRADMRRELLALYPDSSWAQRPEVRN